MEVKANVISSPLDTLDGEVAEGVEIARLLNNSSLGDQEAIAKRLVGRKEISKNFKEHAAGLRSKNDGHQTREDQIDERVADELEHRGYTFEAELRYRRLLHMPGAASRLAMLLEAKGFTNEAWELYAHAARLREPTALFRLAVICQQRGETEWAVRLASSASATIPPTTISALAKNVEGLVAARAFKRPRHRAAAGPVLGTTAATFAMGSMLYVFADRTDLARTAFSHAVGRGHTPSAVALIDMAEPQKTVGNPQLDQILCRADRDLSLTLKEQATWGPPASLRRPFDELRGSLKGSSFKELTAEARCRTTSKSRTEAVERITHLARTITLLRGYARCSDWSPNGFAKLTQASVEVGAEVQRKIRSKPDSVRLARFIWERAGSELAGRLDPTIEGDLVLDYPDTEPEPSSGGVIRYRKEFQRLPDDELETFVLTLAGMSTDAVSEVVEQDAGKTSQTLQNAMARLHAGQAGEQRLPEALNLLFAEVQDALDEVPGEDLVGGRGSSA
ncbi:hypothetical protein [Actinomycetospora flava]|uniref:Uncharacterized protein n=1 Tax=Actinomycetospora flava TaxID=3129232 RepID=A0ABU8MF64_9PSEU